MSTTAINAKVKSGQSTMKIQTLIAIVGGAKTISDPVDQPDTINEEFVDHEISFL
jgi:hypothetical protein